MMARAVVPLLVGISLTSQVAYSTPQAAEPREQDRPRSKPVEPALPPGDQLVTRHAICRWAEEPPMLDGKLDDECWRRAAVIDHFATFWTVPRTPRKGTAAYLAWDKDALYYAGSMTDAELRSFGTRRNDSLWNGDVFELFLKPSAERPEYYEFQANPRGNVFEIAFPRRGHQFAGGFTTPPCSGARPSSF